MSEEHADADYWCADAAVTHATASGDDGDDAAVTHAPATSDPYGDTLEDDGDDAAVTHQPPAPVTYTADPGAEAVTQATAICLQCEVMQLASQHGNASEPARPDRSREPRVVVRRHTRQSPIGAKAAEQPWRRPLPQQRSRNPFFAGDESSQPISSVEPPQPRTAAEAPKPARNISFPKPFTTTTTLCA